MNVGAVRRLSALPFENSEADIDRLDFALVAVETPQHELSSAFADSIARNIERGDGGLELPGNFPIVEPGDCDAFRHLPSAADAFHHRANGKHVPGEKNRINLRPALGQSQKGLRTIFK